jgi:hypothetical protein
MCLLQARRPGGAELFICYAGVQMREAAASKADWVVFDFFLDKHLFAAALLRQDAGQGFEPRQPRALLPSVATGASSPAAVVFDFQELIAELP